MSEWLYERLGGAELPHGRARAVVDAPAERVPLGLARAPVVGALQRSHDDVADPVALEQRPRRARVGLPVEPLDVRPARALAVPPLQLVPRPAEHGRQAGEGRDARMAVGRVVLARALEHDGAGRRVRVEPGDRAGVARRALAQPAEPVERRRAREAVRARIGARDRIDGRRQHDGGRGGGEDAAGTPPGERADPRQAEQQPGLVAELEDGVHAVERTAVELVAHVQQLGPEQARQAAGHEQPDGALRRRRGEDRIQRHGEQDAPGAPPRRTRARPGRPPPAGPPRSPTRGPRTRGRRRARASRTTAPGRRVPSRPRPARSRPAAGSKRRWNGSTTTTLTASAAASQPSAPRRASAASASTPAMTGYDQALTAYSTPSASPAPAASAGAGRPARPAARTRARAA